MEQEGGVGGAGVGGVGGPCGEWGTVLLQLVPLHVCWLHGVVCIAYHHWQQYPLPRLHQLPSLACRHAHIGSALSPPDATTTWRHLLQEAEEAEEEGKEEGVHQQQRRRKRPHAHGRRCRQGQL